MSSSLVFYIIYIYVLKRVHLRYQFMYSKHHKSDAFQVTIQLLVVTIRKIYMRTQAIIGKRLNIERC